MALSIPEPSKEVAMWQVIKTPFLCNKIWQRVLPQFLGLLGTVHYPKLTMINVGLSHQNIGNFIMAELLQEEGPDRITSFYLNLLPRRPIIRPIPTSIGITMQALNSQDL